MFQEEKKIGDGLERIIDLVRDAGGHASCEGELVGVTEGLLGPRVPVISRATLEAPMRSPLESRRGETQSETTMSLPSL